MFENQEQEQWLDFLEFKNRYQKVSVQEYPNRCLENNPKPLVTVLLITYQHRPFIKAAIECVLKQAVHFDFDLLIGDDYSTDGTRDICIDFAKRFPDKIRLFLHHRENNIAVHDTPCGIFQVAYNLFQCRGSYLALISGDDEWTSSEKLQKQVDYLENNREHSMVFLPYQTKKTIGEQVVFSDPDSSYPMPSSIVYRNVFQRIPDAMLSSLNEDDFMTAMALQYGRSKLLLDAGQIVMNHTGSNLWCNNTAIDKEQHTIHTRRRLYRLFGAQDHRQKRGYAYSLANLPQSSNLVVLKNDLKNDFSLLCYYWFYKLRLMLGLDVSPS